MSNNRNRSKFSSEDYSLCLRMYAEGKIPSEIINYFDEVKRPHPGERRIYKIVDAKTNQAEIESYREAYYSRIKDVPITHKRVRTDKIQFIVNAIDKTLPSMLNTKGAIKKQEFKRFVWLVKRLNDMLVRAQEEMEKRPGVLVGITQYFGDRDLSDQELLNEERAVAGRLRKLQGDGVSLTIKKGESPEGLKDPKDKK